LSYDNPKIGRDFLPKLNTHEFETSKLAYYESKVYFLYIGARLICQ